MRRNIMWFGKESDSARFLPREPRASFRGKIRRLGERLKDPEWRRFGGLLLAGKVLGIAAVFGVMFAFELAPHMMGSQTVVAQETPAAPAATPAATDAAAPAAAPDPYDAVKARDIVNPVNTLWVLLAAFLVFGMHVGFTMLEAGFCRSRETVNVLMECIIDNCF